MDNVLKDGVFVASPGVQHVRRRWRTSKLPQQKAKRTGAVRAARNRCVMRVKSHRFEALFATPWNAGDGSRIS